MKLRCLKTLSNATINTPINFTFGGVTFEFTAHIKLIDLDALNKLTTGPNANDEQIVRTLLTGWSGFVDEGETVDFDLDTLDEMLKFGGISGKLSVECVQAQYRVQEKN